MERIPVFVGLDCHQSSVQGCVQDAPGRVLGYRRCPNDTGAIIEFVERQGQVVGAAIESGTGAANLAEELIRRAGWSVDLAHPGFVKRMKQNPDKSDYTDAQLLADLERSDPQSSSSVLKISSETPSVHTPRNLQPF